MLFSYLLNSKSSTFHHMVRSCGKGSPTSFRNIPRSSNRVAVPLGMKDRFLSELSSKNIDDAGKTGVELLDDLTSAHEYACASACPDHIKGKVLDVPTPTIRPRPPPPPPPPPPATNSVNKPNILFSEEKTIKY